MTGKLFGTVLLLILYYPVNILMGNTEIPEEKMKSYSYAIGTTMGKGMLREQLVLDIDSLTKGIKDALYGTTTMSEEQIRETIVDFQQTLQKMISEKQKALGLANDHAGKKFLSENSKKEGVKTTTSGLQYKIENSGNGPKPSLNDVVSVHYRGTLIDGTVFESSYSKGQPATFPLNQVIAGWKEGLQLIGKGGKIRLFVPSELAYGEAGAGSMIGPNATLIFDVELLDILPSKAIGTQ